MPDAILIRAIATTDVCPLFIILYSMLYIRAMRAMMSMIYIVVLC